VGGNAASVGEAFDLTGECALVTGASSGLGRHFSLVLATAGARVALAARRAEMLNDVAREIRDLGGDAIPVTMDITDSGEVAAGLDEAERGLGPISILVNNAGTAVTRPIQDHEERDWDLVMDTNLKGPWLVSRETARRMVAHGGGGNIINIASILGIRVIGQVPSYCASKGGLIQLTKAMALELARYGIRVNALSPGYVETEMNREFFSSKAGQTIIQRIPQRRLGQPKDLDGPLLLLASRASSYMTGATLVVDGGHLVGSL
jgi:NAD(P)-dependent dehydrogenase (short-subunit alcohol dehydrogenase family)